MIYDYYCIDCGEKFKGDEIRFDLAELIGLRQENNETTFAARSTIVDFAQLNEFARRSGIEGGMKHGREYSINVTLKEFLELMAENQNNNELRREINNSNYSNKKEILRRLYTGTAVGEEADDDVRNFEAAVEARFLYELDGEETDDEEKDLGDFVAAFRVKPEFFEDGDSEALYTLEYNYDMHAANLRRMGRGGIIRGYCPKCGKIIIDGAGKYRHNLIGLLGAQKAGKTSTIVAMLEELRLNYRQLGISYPGTPLWDSRAEDRRINLELYRNGWAVQKTAVATSEGSFNATLLIENKEKTKKQLFTFVDIAGEQCFDIETNTVNMNAFQVYPLINRCHVFLLCTGIAPDEADQNEGKNIPPEAVLEISRGIYANLKEPENIPPICIVATKADLAGDAQAQEIDYNPFREISYDPEYMYADELQNFVTLYEAAMDQNVRTALDICFSAYEELSQRTYVSCMSCWALGRKADKLSEEMDIHNIKPYQDSNTGCQLPFKRKRIDRLCKWIFQVTGLVGVDGYAFSHIPSMGESYYADGIMTNGNRKVFSIDEACDRISAVKKVFINLPDKEENLEMELRHFEENPRMFRWAQKRAKMIRELLG